MSGPQFLHLCHLGLRSTSSRRSPRVACRAEPPPAARGREQGTAISCSLPEGRAKAGRSARIPSGLRMFPGRFRMHLCWLQSSAKARASQHPDRRQLPRLQPESPQGSSLLLQALAQGRHPTVTQGVDRNVQAPQVHMYPDHQGQLFAASGSEVLSHRLKVLEVKSHFQQDLAHASPVTWPRLSSFFPWHCLPSAGRAHSLMHMLAVCSLAGM